MTSRVNSFGFPTDPLGFRRKLPLELQAVFTEGLRVSLEALGGDRIDSSSLTDKIWSVLQSEEGEEALIVELKRILKEYELLDRSAEKALVERADRISGQIASYLKDGRVLDWGCGDAFVADRLIGRATTILDIADHRRAMLAEPLVTYDGQNLPTELAGRFENVLLLTVLHHASDPAVTCRHACSLAERVIVIESVPEVEHQSLEKVDAWSRYRTQYEYCGFIDWFYNRVICSDVLVSFNYLPTAAWCQLFAACGFRLAKREILGIDQPVVPEWHVLLVFDRTIALTS